MRQGSLREKTLKGIKDWYPYPWWNSCYVKIIITWVLGLFIWLEALGDQDVKYVEDQMKWKLFPQISFPWVGERGSDALSRRVLERGKQVLSDKFRYQYNMLAFFEGQLSNEFIWKLQWQEIQLV